MSHNGSYPPNSIDNLMTDLVLLYGQEPGARGVNGQIGGRVEQRQRGPSDDDSRRKITSTVHGLALIAAYEAALAVASEVQVEPVLQRIVDLSRTVVPAQYAALGIVGPEKTFTQLFVSGMSEETVHRLGKLPTGHGLLGAVLEDDEPVIIDDLLSHPDRVGFPAHHPEMHSLIGVPIKFDGEVLGNLYLAEPEGDDRFTDEDVVALRILADHAAAAIDRARLYRTVEQGQRTAENQLSQLRDILNALPTGVFVMGTPDAHVNLANTTAIEAILGEDAPADAIPLVYRDFDWQSVDGMPLPRSMHPGMLALRGDPVGNRQLTLVTKRGGQLPVLVQSAALNNHDGEIVGAVVVFQDVTRQRAAEQVKDDFLSLISHEFRTPLTAIHGGAHLLASQGDAIDEETRKELLDDIVIESGRLDRMLANLLRVSEIMAGRFQANMEPILVAPLLQGIIEDLRRRSPGFTFTMNVPADVPLAEGDPELLKQIMRNLYENAVKYSPNGGTIQTAALREGRCVSIRVIDQGAGIAPENVQTVFERFRRPGADATVRGMGLGLYLSRLLVDAQGGRIRAVSDGIGKGATFIVDLPVERGWQAHEPTIGEDTA